MFLALLSLLMKLADLFEENADMLASIESMDNGKAYTFARGFDVAEAAKCLRYYGGWADKEHGKVIEVDNTKMVMTRHEPIGVVGKLWLDFSSAMVRFQR